MRTAECIVCGRAFTSGSPGRPPVTCSEPCHEKRSRDLARIRLERWARRLVARELLGEGSLPAS
jgi:predicted nucleic acid-binding Zn ribbon protein